MGVTNAFYEIILKFGQEVGMKDIFAQSIEMQAGAILVIALLGCFFGLKLVRLCSAVTAFFLTAIAIGEIMRSTANVGAIVTTFAVIGLIAAFITYQWYKFSVFLFSAITGYSMAAAFTGNLWICVGTALVLGIAAILLGPVVVMLTTAIWGGLTIGFSGLPSIGVHLLVFKIIVAADLAAVGLFIQYSMNKTFLPMFGALVDIPLKISLKRRWNHR